MVEISWIEKSRKHPLNFDQHIPGSSRIPPDPTTAPET